VKIDRAAFLAIVVSLAACPEPRAPKKSKSSSDVAPIEVTSEPWRADAPDDPNPIDMRPFPSPAHEAWGMFRPDVQCSFLFEKKDYVAYAKNGIECWGSWKCAGTDDVAKPVDCDAIAQKSGCPANDADGTMSAAILRDECRRNLRVLKPRVAARAAKCMQDEVDYACQRQVDDACREHALFRACPDASVDAVCHAIGESCSKVTLEACRPFVSGLTAEGRSKVVQCMKFKTNCDQGMVSCIDRLGQFD
jgi:hypothetical protein